MKKSASAARASCTRISAAVLAVIALISALLLGGCTGSLPEGYDQVRAAKEKYETLDSGRATMTDLDTGEQLMEFSFMINRNDEMIFSYYGRDGDNETFAYSDGAEYFYKDAGEEMWSVIGPADENYIYNIYNRENRYPYADGGIFFLDASSVEEASVIGGEDGPLTVTYVYDTDRLNSSTQGLFADISSFGALATTFEINAEGFITGFTETGAVTGTDGVTRDINLKITIDMMNEVYEIPYPVDQLKKS